MRLIDEDVLLKNLEWLEDYDHYVLHDIEITIDETPTVKAIPIEWIKKWCNKEHNRKSLEERLLKRYGVITMLEDWEKENENIRG